MRAFADIGIIGVIAGNGCMFTPTPVVAPGGRARRGAKRKDDERDDDIHHGGGGGLPGSAIAMSFESKLAMATPASVVPLHSQQTHTQTHGGLSGAVATPMPSLASRLAATSSSPSPLPATASGSGSSQQRVDVVALRALVHDCLHKSMKPSGIRRAQTTFRSSNSLMYMMGMMIACMYADILAGITRSADDIYLLSWCYYQSAQYRRVIHLLTNRAPLSATTPVDDPRAIYLLALSYVSILWICCMQCILTPAR